MNDTNLITFKAITNFVNELGQMYGKKHHPLKLYRHLINKTQISNDKVILKHIDTFRKFCISNREAICLKNIEELSEDILQYSSKVFINMKTVFKLADSDSTKIIWEHLLCISALVDPAGKAKEILKKNQEEGKTGKNETDFLTDIISKVGENVQPDADPMSAASSIMNSGLLTELMSGMQSGLSEGKLDIKKLLGAVQGMVSTLGEQVGDDPQAAGAMNMINTMMGSMGNLDLGNNAKIEEIPDNKKRDLKKLFL